MNRVKRNLSILVAVALLALVMVAPVAPAQASTSNDDINQAWNRAVGYFQDNIDTMNYGPSPWMYPLALAARGYSQAGVLEITPSIDTPANTASSIIGVMATGGNPRQVTIGGQTVDLIDTLVAMQDVGTGQFKNAKGITLNNTIWAVIALDMYNLNYPENKAGYDTTKAVDYIKSQQKADGFAQGSFCETVGPDAQWVESQEEMDRCLSIYDFSKRMPDPDATSHALFALSNHLANNDPAVISASRYLKSQQRDTGCIVDVWNPGTPADNVSSTAAVIEALLALGIDPQGDDWTKNGNTLVDGLLAHQQEDGGFDEPGSYIDNDGNTVEYTVYNTGCVLGALADLTAGCSKYRTSFPETEESPYVNVEIHPLHAITAGDDCDLLIKIINKQHTDQAALVIAALYDSTGKMITYTYGKYALAEGQTQDLGLGFAVPSGSGYKVKVMVWNDWNNPTPLCAPVVIPVASN